MQTVVALFRNAGDARRAIEALHLAGFDKDNVSLLARDETFEVRDTAEFSGEADDVSAAEGAGIGAVEGGVIGGLAGFLASLGALAIPGIGPVIAAGTLASTLAGAGIGAAAGAATGGIVAALVDTGVPEEDAHVYAEGVKRGGILVMVHPTDSSRANTAVTILKQANAVDVTRERAQWETEGWTRFESGGPARPTGFRNQ